MDKHTVRYDLDHIDDQDHTDVQKCFAERLLILRAVQYVSDAQNMFQKDDPLVTETVVQEIDHIRRRGFETQSPEKQLVFDHAFHATSPPSDNAR